MLPITYRQAAKILQEAKANRKVSVKSLALAKHIEKKRQTYALAMETLKYTAVLDKIINKVGLLRAHPEWWDDMIRVLVYDLLLGMKKLPGHGLCGEVKKHRAKLAAALKAVQKKERVTSVADLLPAQKRMRALPRYVRVNTLKTTVEAAIETFTSAGWELRDKGTVGMFAKWMHEREAALRRKAKRLRREKLRAKKMGKAKKPPRKADATGEGPEAPEEGEGEEEEEGPEGGATRRRRRARGIFFVDPHIPHLLVFPPSTPLHNHPMVKSGELVLQDKASCLPAYLLLHHLPVVSKLDGRGLPPDKLPLVPVMEGGAAPGNKSSCLAALTNNQVQIFAVEKSASRMAVMKERMAFLGCTAVIPVEADFLDLDPADHTSIKAILLDPSCTGSGIVSRAEVAVKRRKPPPRVPAKGPLPIQPAAKGAKDPTEDDGDEEEDGEEEEEGDDEEEEEDGGSESENDGSENDPRPAAQQRGRGKGAPAGEAALPEEDTREGRRLRQLSAFQKRLLRHALRFPKVDRVVYSTCSVHDLENERVIEAVMADPEVSAKFKLVNIMPQQWTTRARPLFENAQFCIRCEPTKDFTNGFFVACIERIQPREARAAKRKADEAAAAAEAAEAEAAAADAAAVAAGEATDVVDAATRRLARELGQLPKKRFKADPNDPANHVQVEGYRTRQKCTICQIRGHFSRDCPHRMCPKCRVRGHRPEDCTNPPYLVPGAAAAAAPVAAEPVGLQNKDGTRLTGMSGLVKDTYGVDRKTLRRRAQAKPGKKEVNKKEARKEGRKRVRKERELARKTSVYKKNKQQRKFNLKMKKSGASRRL